MKTTRRSLTLEEGDDNAELQKTLGMNARPLQPVKNRLVVAPE